MAATHFSGPLVIGGVYQPDNTTNIIAAATTLTAADCGIHILDAAAGATVTLPDIADGLYFKFIVGAAFATSNWVVAASAGDVDKINGIIADMGTTVAGVDVAAADQINFVATAEQIGDWVEFVADSSNDQWLVSGTCGINGGITATG